MGLSFPAAEHTEILAEILKMPFWLYSIVVSILSAVLFASLAYSVHQWITVPYLFEFFGIDIVTTKSDEF
jgi:hypothetical protein